MVRIRREPTEPAAPAERRGDATSGGIGSEERLRLRVSAIARALTLNSHARLSASVSEQLVMLRSESTVDRETLVRENHARQRALSTQMRELHDALLTAVGDHVRELRAAGAPPEAVLARVKQIVGDAARAELSSRDADALVWESTQHAIDAYYAPPRPRD